MELEHSIFILALREQDREPPLQALSELFSKLVRLNRSDAFFTSWLAMIWKRTLGPAGTEYLAGWSFIFGQLGELERAIESLFRAIDSRILAKNASLAVVVEIARKLVVPILKHPTRAKSTFDSLLGSKFLLRLTFSTRILRLMFASLDEFYFPSVEWRSIVMENLLRLWTNRDWIGHVGDHQHKCELQRTEYGALLELTIIAVSCSHQPDVTSAILCLLPYFVSGRGGTPEAFGPALRMLFTTGFGQYLSATEPRIRARGMLVGEEVSKVVAASFKAESRKEPSKEGDEDLDQSKLILDFGLHETPEVDELRTLAREDLNSPRGPSVLEVLFQSADAKDPVNESEPAPSNFVPVGRDQQEPDSDDESVEDEDDEFIPYDMDPDEFPSIVPTESAMVISKPRPFVPPSKMAIKDGNKAKIPPPTYVRELVAYLRSSSDDAIKQEMALIHAISVVRGMRDLDWKENGAELVIWLLRCEDSFELDHFSQLRGAALVEVATRGAGVVIPVLVGEFYDRNYSLSHRLEILDCLAVAARDLSSLDDDPAEDDPTLARLSVDQGGKLPSVGGRNLESLAARIAQNTKRFSKKTLVEKSRKSPKPNRWSVHAEAAVLSLIGRIGSPSNQWDPLRNGGSETPLLLDRMLMCATVMVWSSAYVLGLSQMCRELFNFAWSLRSLRPAPLNEADEFDAALPRSDVPATAALAMTVAFSMLSQHSVGRRSSLDLFYSTFTDTDVSRAAEWAMDMIEEGTGGDDHRSRAAELLNVIKDILETRRKEIFGSDVNEIL